MRVALIHDYLNQYGGAEKVLEALIETFPQAEVYTLFYDKEKTHGRFDGKIKNTSFLDKKIVRDNHRWFIPLMPVAIKTMAISDDYDVIISDTAGFAKGIRYRRNQNRRPVHIAYCHTPLRYAWEQREYLTPLISNFQFLISKPILNYLRYWDYQSGQKPDLLLANSNYIAAKIKKYYNRNAEVIYPPVDLKTFYPDSTVKRGGYFLAVGRMLPYKRFDLIIDAFAALKLPLKIVGSGPEKLKLKAQSLKLKARNIEFLPFASEDQLRILYSGAEAFIFPQVEDFGLVAAEAQACGAPVIAFSQGGAREIVQDGVTGIFFHNQNVEDLKKAVQKFALLFFDEKVIRKSAQRFSKVKFQNKILKKVNQLIKNA